MKQNIALSIFALTMITLFHSCAPSVDKINNKTWEGQLYRTSDNKQLAETVKLKITKDTLFVFSNAVLGADNDTLILTKYDAKDSSYTYKNKNGENIYFKLEYVSKDTNEYLYLNSSDFYLVLGISNSELNSPDALNYYHNISVPRNPHMYLDGTYKGEIEFENLMTDFFSTFTIGPMKMKFVFLDDFKIKIYGSSIWVNTSEVQSYTVKGDKIFVGKKGVFHTEGFRVVDNGSKLVYQSDKFNLILRKSY